MPLSSRSLSLAAAMAAAGTTAIVGLHAQTPPPTKIEVLSPFIVATDRDAGWVASSTLLGNRSNEQLINLPLSVDVLTADFMRDMGVFELEDASAMIANTVVVSNLASKLDEARVTFRGFTLGDNVQAQSGRNFFPVYTPQDVYNVDRIDFGKGANSLMFGSEQPGGLATTYTKRANFSNFSTGTIVVDSFGSYRFMLDLNRRVNDSLAVRVNAVNRSDRTYIDFAKVNLHAYDATVTYKVFPNTEVRVEAEAGHFYRLRAVNSARINTTSTPGLGYSQTTRWTYSQDDGVVYSTGGTTPSPANPADRVGGAGGLVSFLQGQTVNIAMRNYVNGATVYTGQTLTLHGLSRSINLDGPNDFLGRPYTGVTAWVDQRFGDLNVELSYNQQDQNQQRMDGGIPNQIDLTVTNTGRLFEEGAYQYKQFGNIDKNIRMLASYPIKLKWMTQFIVGSFEKLEDAAFNFRYTLGNLAPGTLTNNDIKYRVYLDDPGYRTGAFWKGYQWQNLPRTATFQPAWRSATTANRPFWDVRYTHTLALSANGTYFGGLIRTLVGIRRDQFDRKLDVVPGLDAIGNVPNPGSPNDNPRAYFYDPKFNQNNNSVTSGLVFQVLRNVNVYGTFSESFNWQGTTDFAGNALGAILGQNREAGIKTSLFDDRLFATAAVYRVDKTNAAFSFGGSLSNAQLDAMFNPPGSGGTFVSETGFNGEVSTASSTARSTGYELTVEHQRMLGFQSRVSFGHNHLTTHKDMSPFRLLYNQAAAAAAVPANAAYATANAANLAAALKILQNNEGVTQATGVSSVPNTLAWSTDYQLPRFRFDRGRTRIGVTAVWNDNYNIAFTGGVLYRNGAALPLGFYLIHERPILKHEVFLRLGLRNVVDLENGKLRKTGVDQVDLAGNPNYDYQYVAPVSADFNVSVRF